MTQITEKVTAQRLDTMYLNFVKITDWLLKGEASAYPMPAPFAELFAGIAKVREQKDKLAEQAETIAGLQAAMIKQTQVIEALAVRINPLADEAQAQATQAQATQAQATQAQATQAQAQAQATQAQAQDPLQVSAEAVGAGNLDPAAYAALDAEINNLLNGG